jgi:Peptidogalycan biosysnthesis/recognition
MSTGTETIPTVAGPDQSSCCGSSPTQAPHAGVTGSETKLRVGVPLTVAVESLPDELQAADTWPYLLPSWIGATERAMPGARAWHSVARADGDAVFIPGFMLDKPDLVDADPRTYLGWEAPSGESACCGAKAAGNVQGLIDELGVDTFFPALLLGSPLGFRSDAVVVGSPAPDLTIELVNQLIGAAQSAGVRSVIAPWVSDRPVNGPLLAALHSNGAAVSFWGEENYLQLAESSYQAHLEALSYRRRYRFKEDDNRIAESGAQLVRIDGKALRPHVERIAELTVNNRQKYDGSEGVDHITTVLSALVDEGADVRAYLAYQADTVVASCVTIRQADRLVVKWAGFDYEALGERSGLYFAMTLTRPLQDAYAEGIGFLELGPGADQAKRLRGCQPRSLYTALWISDPAVRDQVSALQGAYGGLRREALGAEAADEPPTSRGRMLGRLKPKKADAQDCCG